MIARSSFSAVVSIPLWVLVVVCFVFYPKDFYFYKATGIAMLLLLGILIVSLIRKFFALLLLSVLLFLQPLRDHVTVCVHFQNSLVQFVLGNWGVPLMVFNGKGGDPYAWRDWRGCLGSVFNSPGGLRINFTDSVVTVV